MSEETAITPNDESLVTIASFQEPLESNMARMALEASGIDVIIRGENANSMIPAAFETQLQVRSADEEAARAILDEVQSSPATEQEVTEAEIAAETNGQ
ncbi:MAG: DUF2007 domain-containing protein [Acidobacteriota bacterium]